MAITPLPPAPSRGEPPNLFIQHADAFLGALGPFGLQLQATADVITQQVLAVASNTALAQAAANAALGASTAFGTSITPVTLTGAPATLTWTIQTGRTIQIGQYMRASLSSAPVTTYVAGVVTAYNPASGALSISTDSFGPVTGQFSDWTITVASKNGMPASTLAVLKDGTSQATGVTPDVLMRMAGFVLLADTPTIDWNTRVIGPNAYVIPTSSRTFGVPSGVFDGMTYALAIVQGGGGNNGIVWTSVWDWGEVGAPALSTIPGKVDFVYAQYFIYTGKLHAQFRKAL